MAKLKPDYIEWVLKLNATQAQEEYHKLEKESKNLKSLMNANPQPHASEGNTLLTSQIKYHSKVRTNSAL